MPRYQKNPRSQDSASRKPSLESSDESRPHQDQLDVRPQSRPPQVRLQKELFHTVIDLAEWLERDYPSAAASLIEGLEECFTINRLDMPASLHRCLATTNVIESPMRVSVCGLGESAAGVIAAW